MHAFWPFFEMSLVCLLALPESQGDTKDAPNKKRKDKGKHAEQLTAPHQNLVFVATKHHVEYVTNLLSTAGYAVSHIYGFP